MDCELLSPIVWIRVLTRPSSQQDYCLSHGVLEPALRVSIVPSHDLLPKNVR